MKDRTREAVMNLLGGTLENHIAFDLFGGSGVMAFEAISRGASHAFTWEILKSGAHAIQNFAQSLQIQSQITVLHEDVLRWSSNLEQNLEFLNLPSIEPSSEQPSSPDQPTGPEELAAPPWVLFCCPPYAMWETQGQEIKEMIRKWILAAPPRSLFAIELEVNTDLQWLPTDLQWDMRKYNPAVIAIGQKD
jgi:16S rRNA G966 N2-methylase RsmD